MSASSTDFTPRDFDTGLKPFKQRLLKVLSSEVCLGLATLWLALFVSAMWLDSVIALPMGLRWFITRIGLLVAIATVCLLIWWRSRRLTAQQITQQLDQATSSGGQLLAGWQLSTRPVRPQSELSQGLAAMAAQRALERLGKLSPDLVTNWQRVQRITTALTVVLGGTLLVAALAPQAAMNQFKRFLFPASDIPPYTGVIIELELERDQILYGQDVIVTAHVLQGRAERMLISSRNEAGDEQLLPMLAQNTASFQAILTRVTEPLTLVARSGSSRSVARRLNVTMTPKILPPSVTITPPAYTRGSVYRGPIPEQGLVGLKGTRVDWQVRSNRPLREGELTIETAPGRTEVVRLLPDEAAAPDTSSVDSSLASVPVVGSFQLSQAGQFELKVIDIDGTPSQESIRGTITILSDKRPIVRIVQPQPLSLATPDVALPVTVMAEDDYGITQLTLFRSLNGSPALPIDASVDGSPRVQAHWQLPLPSYRLQPGDEIQLFARSEDNDPSGAKGAESPVTTVRIISVQEFQELMVQRQGAESMQAKYQAARRYFDQLASALEEVRAAQTALAADDLSSEARAQLQEKLNAALKSAQAAAEQAASEIAKLSEQPLPIDIDQELVKELAAMSQQASEMAEQLAQMAAAEPSTNSPESQEQIAQMLRETKQAQQQVTDQAINPLKTMQQTLPLMMDQQRFQELAAMQRDLAERLTALRTDNKHDPASARRIAELETQQQQLKESLADLLDDIEAHATALPPDPELEKLRSTALDFARRVRDSQAQAEMAAAQTQLLSDEFSKAQQAARNAADILESFLSQCNSMGDEAGQQCQAAFNPSAQSKVGNSLKQMLSMMGMKPGASGMKPGGRPGMGLGFGAGGGFAQRFPGPQNVGMYGSLPMPQAASGRSQGDRPNPGFQTSQTYDTQAGGNSSREGALSSQASVQAINAIPPNYRSKVAEYFRQLSTVQAESTPTSPQP